MKLDQLLNNQWSQSDIQAYFDRLPAVSIDELHGLWLGNEINTPHPMTGLLKKAGWYGKYFASKDDVTPIVLMDKHDHLFAANPGLLSIHAPLNIIKRLPAPVFKHAVTLIKPIFKTHSSKARLRMIDYKGTWTAAMIYDQKPLIDVFKKVDDNTYIGRVEETVISQKLTHYFVLSRTNRDWRPY